MLDAPQCCPFCRSLLAARVLTAAYSERWCEPCQRVISPLQPLTTATRRLSDWQGFILWLERIARPEFAQELGRYLDAHRLCLGARDPVTLVLDHSTARRVDVAWNIWQGIRAHNLAETAAIVAAAVEIVAEHQRRRP